MLQFGALIFGYKGAFIFKKGGGGGLGWRNPYEHKCKIPQPSLYTFC